MLSFNLFSHHSVFSVCHYYFSFRLPAIFSFSASSPFQYFVFSITRVISSFLSFSAIFFFLFLVEKKKPLSTLSQHSVSISYQHFLFPASSPFFPLIFLVSSRHFIFSVSTSSTHDSTPSVLSVPRLSWPFLSLYNISCLNLVFPVSTVPHLFCQSASRHQCQHLVFSFNTSCFCHYLVFSFNTSCFCHYLVFPCQYLICLVSTFSSSISAVSSVAYHPVSTSSFLSALFLSCEHPTFQSVSYLSCQCLAYFCSYHFISVCILSFLSIYHFSCL